LKLDPMKVQTQFSTQLIVVQEQQLQVVLTLELEFLPIFGQLTPQMLFLVQTQLLTQL